MRVGVTEGTNTRGITFIELKAGPNERKSPSPVYLPIQLANIGPVMKCMHAITGIHISDKMRPRGHCSFIENASFIDLFVGSFTDLLQVCCRIPVL
jgi:hypothetical protein